MGFPLSSTWLGARIPPSSYSQMLLQAWDTGFISTAGGSKENGLRRCGRSLLLSIAFLEFYPLVVAVCCWGQLLRNRKVRFHTDNTAVVHIINSQTSKCDRIMHLVRLFVCHCLTHNIVFKEVHVPGVHNVIADSLSRF